MSSSAAVEEEGAAVAMGGEEAVAETKPASSSSKDEDEEMDDHDSDDVDEDSEEDDGDDEDEMGVERREDGRGVATDSSTAEKEEVGVAGDGVEYSEQPPAAICCVVMEPWTSDGTHRICLPNMFQDNVNVESALGPALKAAFMVMGCISVSMTLHQTSFCFICSHLASGEKEGDELRRNLDVLEILRVTQFPRICRRAGRRIPEKILDHDRVIWLGDLNYRISLSYEDTKKLLTENNWDALFEKDQLNIERNSGRVFKGWSEEKIYFAPTYKYSCNSDSYAGETATSKKKRRTPAWYLPRSN